MPGSAPLPATASAPTAKRRSAYTTAAAAVAAAGGGRIGDQARLRIDHERHDQRRACINSTQSGAGELALAARRRLGRERAARPPRGEVASPKRASAAAALAGTPDSAFDASMPGHRRERWTRLRLELLCGRRRWWRRGGGACGVTVGPRWARPRQVRRRLRRRASRAEPGAANHGGELNAKCRSPSALRGGGA